MNKTGIKIAFLGILLSGGILAQTQKQTQSVTSKVEESSDKYKVETNHFFENWFAGAGIGGQVYFGKNDSKQSLSKRITPAYNVYIGKWFTPGIGLRVGVDGSSAKALSLYNRNWYEQYYNTGETYVKDGVTYYRQKINYIHLNAEALFNMSNLLGGYKEDRFYNAIPYLGFGWMISKRHNTSREDELSIVGGFLNTFRLNNSLNLTLDVKGNLFNAHFSHKKTIDVNEPGSADKVLNASIGLIYKFNKRNWDRSKTITNTITISYSDEELNKLREKADALAKANEALKQELANSSNGKTKTQTTVDKSVFAPPLLITFPINKSTLSKEARVNLGYFAKIVKEKPGIIYTITGYADKGTGTPEINEKLSRDRAEVVYNALIKEFGVDPARLKPNYQGGVDNLFYDDPRLSRAVIAFEMK